MRRAPYVFLVPGFLGFVGIGRFSYFRGVAECLRGAVGDGDESPTFVRVETLPSASLRERAARLAEVIREHAIDDQRPLHLVAHSTGGLDARLLLTPGAALPVAFDLEPLLARVRSVVTVATPHHGTPLASFFDGMFGQRVMWLGSLCAAHAVRVGRLPLGAMRRLAAVLGRPGRSRRVGKIEAVISDVRGELLDALPADERDPLLRLLDQMREDQALVPQLAPEGVALFNAATNDRPGVRYGCVLTVGARPGMKTAMRTGLRPHGQASLAVYTALHRLTARVPERWRGGMGAVRTPEVGAAYGGYVRWSDSDGVVPTLSQLWGDLVHVARSDHLDVVGHFADDEQPVEHYDLMVSGSGFGRADFEAVWRDVAGFMRRAESVPMGVVADPALRLEADALVGGARGRLGHEGNSRPGIVALERAGSAGERSPAVREDEEVSVSRWVAVRRAAAQGVGVTLAFFGYEAWRMLVGEEWVLRLGGFAAGMMALMWAVTRGEKPRA